MEKKGGPYQGGFLASQGYYLGLESVRLRERRPRVVEYGHGKENDWRTKQVLNN